MPNSIVGWIVGHYLKLDIFLTKTMVNGGDEGIRTLETIPRLLP